MTTVYFIRHSESDATVRDGRIRPLTEKGLADRKLVTAFLQDEKIDAVLSSPFKRAVDTVADFADKNNLVIELVEDFREQKSSSDLNRTHRGFEEHLERQWADFTYKVTDGESLYEVQKRNISALNEVLIRYKDKNIVIGTHGTALSTIINYYDNTYGFKDFTAMVYIQPWIVEMYFNDTRCAGMRKIDLFHLAQKTEYDGWKICTYDLGTLKIYRFVVIFSRYQDKWLYCCAKTRDTFETAGGHIEQGETPLEAAKRELYEETGAVSFDISPAFDYSVHTAEGYSNGQVFFAQIHELGDMPEYEMAEIRLFAATPDKMRFPKILPVLYDKMQAWLKYTFPLFNFL